MLKRLIVSAVTSALILCTGCGKSETTDSSFSRDIFAMDTYMNMKVWAADGDSLLDTAAKRINELENTLSVTKETSDIAKLNNGGTITLSNDSSLILRTALDIGGQTDGALDISVYPITKAWGFTTGENRIPEEGEIKSLLENVDYRKITPERNVLSLPEGMQIDLGALAKGYTSDTLMQMFRDSGAESAIVTLGGNVQALGHRPDGTDWKVGVVDPFSPTENLCIIEIADKAVITSGNYERYFEKNGKRYHHIIDPADGYPADNGLVSVTIIGNSGLMCDALSTALFVLGEDKAIAYYKAHKDFDMVLVTEDKRILYTKGLEGHFTNISKYTAKVISDE